MQHSSKCFIESSPFDLTAGAATTADGDPDVKKRLVIQLTAESTSTRIKRILASDFGGLHGKLVIDGQDSPRRIEGPDHNPVWNQAF